MRVRFPSPAPLRLPHVSGNHSHHSFRLIARKYPPRRRMRISWHSFCTCRSPRSSAGHHLMGWRTRRDEVRCDLSASAWNVGSNAGLRRLQHVRRLLEPQRVHTQCSKWFDETPCARVDSRWRVHQWCRFNSLVSRKRTCITWRSGGHHQLPTWIIRLPRRRQLRNA